MLKGPFIICVGILISILRFCIGKVVGTEVITFIMAIINVIALNYVCMIIIDDVYKNISFRLNESALPDEQKKILRRNVKRITITVAWGLFLVASGWYICEWYDSMWNDILSIMALVISISSEDITIYLSDKIYQKI